MLLAFVCNFVLLGSYYILRPVRDTVATVFGVGQLQNLFTATFIGTLIASPIYAALASRLQADAAAAGRVLVLAAQRGCCSSCCSSARRRTAGSARSYYVWFSVVNLFMISVFWSLMVDLFSPRQATRLFALIAAGGELGAIAGPLLTRWLVQRLGLRGLLLLAARRACCCVIALVHVLMREKAAAARRRRAGTSTRRSSMQLPGNPFEASASCSSSRYALAQAGFMLLMTWVNTVAYFFQTDLVAHAFAAHRRARRRRSPISTWWSISLTRVDPAVRTRLAACSASA